MAVDGGISFSESQGLRYLPPKDLKPWKRNARKHSKRQLHQIAESIQTFGFTNPVLIDQNLTILAGHGRVAAAISLGMERVPCLFVEHLTPEQKRAYVLADNKIALNSTWDEDLLAEELKNLSEAELNFEIETIGFSVSEIDALIDAPAPEEDGDPREEVLPPVVQSRVRPGDIWQLGQHRLICGNSLEPEIIDRLMDGEKATMIFTDPPYNVPIDGHVGGKGKVKHDEFAMASGEMSQAEFTAFLQRAFGNLCRHSINGSIHFICMDWRHMQEVLQAGEDNYTELKNLIVWAKDNAGMGSFYRSRHELIFAFKLGDEPHINSFELGQYGRYRTNVWDYRSANLEELGMHPTVKPVSLIADAIRDVSGRRDIVLDIFGGSGSTLIAAEKTGRKAYLVEIDPAYCDVILTRWERYEKDEAVLLHRSQTQQEVGGDHD